MLVVHVPHHGMNFSRYLSHPGKVGQLSSLLTEGLGQRAVTGECCTTKTGNVPAADMVQSDYLPQHSGEGRAPGSLSSPGPNLQQKNWGEDPG
ncbi:hypothetical protein J0S82_012239, partial [Galemys pyrenaicus]